MALKSHNPEVFSLFLRFSLIMIFPLLLNFMMGLVEMLQVGIPLGILTPFLWLLRLMLNSDSDFSTY